MIFFSLLFLLTFLFSPRLGMILGKGGSKIKEIRESTGCSIQVASDMLPNSTEREVKLTGTAEQITQCIFHICCVMLEVILPPLFLLFYFPPFSLYFCAQRQKKSTTLFVNINFKIIGSWNLLCSRAIITIELINNLLISITVL